MACATSKTKILPSPILPVRAAVVRVVHYFVQAGVRDHYLDFHLGQQVHVVFLAAVRLRVAFLPPVAADFGQCHAIHPDGEESFLYFVQLEGLHNRFQFFHS